MKRLLAILPLVTSCMSTPAWASSATSGPAPEPQAKAYELDAQSYQAVVGYLQQSAILYSVKCEENNNTKWFCNAESILIHLQKNAVEVKHEPKTDKPKPAAK